VAAVARCRDVAGRLDRDIAIVVHIGFYAFQHGANVAGRDNGDVAVVIDFGPDATAASLDVAGAVYCNVAVVADVGCDAVGIARSYDLERAGGGVNRDVAVSGKSEIDTVNASRRADVACQAVDVQRIDCRSGGCDAIGKVAGAGCSQADGRAGAGSRRIYDGLGTDIAWLRQGERSGGGCSQKG
jgi:hypothetical protein